MNKGTVIFLVFCMVLGGIALLPSAHPVSPEPAYSALSPHEPIRIDSDAGFNATNGVAAGNGSAVNPWVIENLEIDANGTGPCIFIGNTTLHFEIRNCTLLNASGRTYFPDWLGGGIVLSNVSGGSVANCTLVNSSYGLVISDSVRVNASMNNASANADNGILVASSGNITLDNNTLSGNQEALNLSSLTEPVRIHNNTVIDNGIGMLASAPFSGVVLYHNSFINNTSPATDDGAMHWDAGYPVGGNYWDTYNGTDANGDGLGDSPMTLDADSVDRYPLMSPYTGQGLGESVPPFALNYSPVGLAAPPDAKIIITWNETMNWTSVETAFSYTDGAANWTSANGTWLHDPATNTSTFTPAGDLAYETLYTVTVNCTAADIVGNMLDQDGNGTGGEWPGDMLTWNFTTRDAAPFVVSTLPADGQVDVDPATSIRITFSEPMNRTSVEDAFSYTNGSLTWNTGNGTEAWNAEGTAFTFMPNPPLERNQTFTLTLNGSLARDEGGRPMGADHVWQFTTWLEPPPPHVVSTYPPGGTNNVPVATYINMAFDMEMDVQSVEGAFTYTDGTGVWDISSGMVDWFSGGTLFSFQPAEILEFDTTYTVRLNSTAMSTYGKTLDGNNNGISERYDDFVFTFTTGPEPPTVLSHYPGADQSGVPVSLDAIYINFSKSMDTVSVTNGISVSPGVDFMPSFSSDQRNLTLLLNSDLRDATQYRVTVSGTATDVSGLNLDGNGDGAGGDRFSFTFSTEGLATLEPPFILYVYPRANSTVPADQFTMSVTFSQEMNTTSVEEAFSFSNATEQVNGTFRWTMSSKTMWFMPDAALEPNTTYLVSIQGTAKDTNGLFLNGTASWQYTTEPEAAPTSITDLLIYGTILALLLLSLVLYMANRSLKKELRRTRVKLKRLSRRYGALAAGTGDISGERAADRAEPTETAAGEDAGPHTDHNDLDMPDKTERTAGGPSAGSE